MKIITIINNKQLITITAKKPHKQVCKLILKKEQQYNMWSYMYTAITHYLITQIPTLFTYLQTHRMLIEKKPKHQGREM